MPREPIEGRNANQRKTLLAKFDTVLRIASRINTKIKTIALERTQL